MLGRSSLRHRLLRRAFGSCRHAEAPRSADPRNGAVNDDGAVLPPCGRCRELIYQIDPANLDTDVIVERNEVVKLRDLLPHPWQPKHWPG